ncbi:MAG: aminotransferase class I/II-fold pyridoxal phosphate-dependent enzyme [Actinomycetota bacterium]|nr:aminotransferase class I/II-fold pyridoxal phosphate-dependent enzyme [Actinomycetota bacterium]
MVSRQISEQYDSWLGGFARWSASLPEDRPVDMLFGNPHDLVSAAYVEALQRAARPDDAHAYAYTMDLPAATEAIAEGLRSRFDMPFAAEHVAMTNGNFTGLAATLRAVADPGDEVVYVSPPWFFYESLIQAGGMTPVRVVAVAGTYDLDLEAIERAIGPRTRAIIVNSPNNPTGRIYPPSMLDDLSALLLAASERHGAPIYLLSDEAYNRVVFDERSFHTPVAHYPYSFLLYTYAKTLLSPGSRLGYVAMSPTMPDTETVAAALLLARITTGWGFPISLLQRAVPDLERMEPAVPVWESRRDRLCGAMADQGYDLIIPEGTFYVLARAPLGDDRAFCDALARDGVWVLPGAMFESPGRFRISLTANDDMIDRAIPAFARAIEAFRS